MIDWTTIEQNIVAQMPTLTANFVEGFFALLLLVIISIIGYIIARILGHFLKYGLHKLELEKRMKELHLHNALFGFTLTGIAALFLEIWVFLVFLGIGAEVSNIGFLMNVSTQALGYVSSNLITGTAIMVTALLIGDYITDRIKRSKLNFANPIAVVIEVFIAYNALVIALPVLVPLADTSLLVNSATLAIGAVFLALGLGFAIAIGLGAKDMVKAIAKKKQQKIEKLL